MTPLQKIQMQRMLGNTVLKIQNEFKDELPPEDLLPEIVSSLLSLSADIACHNCYLSSAQWLRGAIEVMMAIEADPERYRGRVNE